MATHFNDQPTLPYMVYEGGASLPFDLHYSMLLSDRVKMADSEGLQILNGLQKAWRDYVLGEIIVN